MSSILTDRYNRTHNYLRISITEKCNLRCTYCMPENGVDLSPKSRLMTCDEIYTIAKIFVDNGVTKIRITGGEPMIRKDIGAILRKLASLNVRIGITTNAINIDRYIDLLKECNVKDINVSLDSLNLDKFEEITRRNFFNKVYKNIIALSENGFNVKLNAVLIRDFNDDEIIDFVEMTKNSPIIIRFIEFMPFDGNKWNLSKMVSLQTIIDTVNKHYGEVNVKRINDEANDTSKNFKIANYKGNFAVISSVTNPFCDSCNRLRLTANGQLKNCLFSADESDLLTSLRAGKSILPIIQKAVAKKLKIRGGMDTLEKLRDEELHSKNRNMTSIGG